MVKDMEANMLIGKDTQRAWQLHIIRKETNNYWKVGDSVHLIPIMPGPMPAETFSAQWSQDKNKTNQMSSSHKRMESSKKQWNAVAKYDQVLEPESIASVTVISRGIPCRESMHFEAIPLKRGPDSFISAPHGIINLGRDNTFIIKVANTTTRRTWLRAGNLLGFLTKASDTLKSTRNLLGLELDQFKSRASQLAALVLNQDVLNKTSQESVAHESMETMELQDTEHLSWGSKTTDPGPDHIHPLQKLKEVMDVDPALDPSQREALYKIIEENQAAFGFNGRLGHLNSRVHHETRLGAVETPGVCRGSGSS
jgi:hypothetical protein